MHKRNLSATRDERQRDEQLPSIQPNCAKQIESPFGKHTFSPTPKNAFRLADPDCNAFVKLPDCTKVLGFLAFVHPPSLSVTHEKFNGADWRLSVKQYKALNQTRQ